MEFEFDTWRLLQVWAEVYEQIITGLFFLEIIMIALLAIKKSFAAILVRTSINPSFCDSHEHTHCCCLRYSMSYLPPLPLKGKLEFCSYGCPFT